jgi:CubicO group peptidase (beta-lactamase class C family)
MRKNDACLVILLMLSLLTTSIIPVSGWQVETRRFQGNNQNGIFNDFFTDMFINLIMKFNRLPSLSACAIRNDEVVWAKAYGSADIENSIPATVDTVYLVGSISKVITATAVMQLYEQGYFDLDDDVNNFLPFSLRNPKYPDISITYRMLLSHHSSLARLEGQELGTGFLIYNDMDVEGYPYPFFKEFLLPNGSLYEPRAWTDYEPGEAYYYSSYGIAILGYLVEIISGQEFNSYCKEHIFEPLEMYNTSFRLDEIDRDNLAVPYDYYHFLNFNNRRMPHYGYMFRPAGNLRTSVRDLSHFVIAHLNGGVYKEVRILNESNVELMQTVQFEDEDIDYNIGLGWIITEKDIGHGGSWFGCKASMVLRPDGTAIIWFTNTFTPKIEYLKIPLLSHLLFLKAGSFL